MNCFEKLALATLRNNSLICIGLDPDWRLMPEKIDVFNFNRAIIEATSDLVCAYKPNLAFYEAMGKDGMDTLKRTLQYIPKEIPVIADAKRGDIGNTSKAYAIALFDIFNFDAATVNPYLGFDAVEPFLQYKNKGTFILCRTSNPGAMDFQSLLCETPKGLRPLYEIVAEKTQEWNANGNIGLVVGATYPEELRIIRQQNPDMPFLIPGIGVQGGNIALTVQYGANSNGEKAIINSSRQIIYASRNKDFAEAARNATISLRNEVNKYRSNLKS